MSDRRIDRLYPSANLLAKNYPRLSGGYVWAELNLRSNPITFNRLQKGLTSKRPSLPTEYDEIFQLLKFAIQAQGRDTKALGKKLCESIGWVRRRYTALTNSISDIRKSKFMVCVPYYTTTPRRSSTAILITFHTSDAISIDKKNRFSSSSN